MIWSIHRSLKDLSRIEIVSLNFSVLGICCWKRFLSVEKIFELDQSRSMGRGKNLRQMEWTSISEIHHPSISIDPIRFAEEKHWRRQSKILHWNNVLVEIESIDQSFNDRCISPVEPLQGEDFSSFILVNTEVWSGKKIDLQVSRNVLCFLDRWHQLSWSIDVAQWIFISSHFSKMNCQLTVESFSVPFIQKGIFSVPSFVLDYLKIDEWNHWTRLNLLADLNNEVRRKQFGSPLESRRKTDMKSPERLSPNIDSTADRQQKGTKLEVQVEEKNGNIHTIVVSRWTIKHCSEIFSMVESSFCRILSTRDISPSLFSLNLWTKIVNGIKMRNLFIEIFFSWWSREHSVEMEKQFDEIFLQPIQNLMKRRMKINLRQWSTNHIETFLQILFSDQNCSNQCFNFQQEKHFSEKKDFILVQFIQKHLATSEVHERIVPSRKRFKVKVVWGIRRVDKCLERWHRMINTTWIFGVYRSMTTIENLWKGSFTRIDLSQRHRRTVSRENHWGQTEKIFDDLLIFIQMKKSSLSFSFPSSTTTTKRRTSHTSSHLTDEFIIKDKKCLSLSSLLFSSLLQCFFPRLNRNQWKWNLFFAVKCERSRSFHCKRIFISSVRFIDKTLSDNLGWMSLERELNMSISSILNHLCRSNKTSTSFIDQPAVVVNTSNENIINLKKEMNRSNERERKNQLRNEVNVRRVTNLLFFVVNDLCNCEYSFHWFDQINEWWSQRRNGEEVLRLTMEEKISSSRWTSQWIDRNGVFRRILQNKENGRKMKESFFVEFSSPPGRFDCWSAEREKYSGTYSIVDNCLFHWTCHFLNERYRQCFFRKKKKKQSSRERQTIKWRGREGRFFCWWSSSSWANLPPLIFVQEDWDANAEVSHSPRSLDRLISIRLICIGRESDRRTPSNDKWISSISSKEFSPLNCLLFSSLLFDPLFLWAVEWRNLRASRPKHIEKDEEKNVVQQLKHSERSERRSEEDSSSPTPSNPHALTLTLK